MFDRLAKDTEDLVTSIVEMVYFMRGSIGYEEMMVRTPGERQLINQFLERRLAAEKDKTNPTY